MSPFVVPAVNKKSWYKTWWGAAIIAGGCLLLAAGLALGVLLYNYWQAIKSGQGAVLQQQIYGSASGVVNQAAETPEIKKARQELESSDDPFLGNQNASLVIVEFIDFQCPICKGQYPEMQQLINKYGYKIKWIVRDFPMESVHPGTTRLAAIASCANEQGGFWLAHDYFFTNQDTLGANLTDAEVDLLSDQFGLDKNKMSDCLKNRRGEIEAKMDYSIGVKYGIKKGTPAFFINGRKFEGGIPFSAWENILKENNV